MITLNARLTSAGLAKLFAASNMGLAAQISHLALGVGYNRAAPGYVPTVAQVSLVNEAVRQSVGGGERVDTNVILVSAAFDYAGATGFWAHELGVFLSDGTLLAVHSDPLFPLTWVGAGETVILAVSLGLSEIPDGTLTWQTTGPSVNLTLTEPLVNMNTAIVGLQARVLVSELARLVPQIEAIGANL
jgi:phage-related tail fiber protein